MSQINYRTINIDQLDPESSVNFPMETLLPATLPQPGTSSEAANVATQVRQLLRGGDAEGALRAVLDTAPLGGDEGAKQVHLATVTEVLQGIRQGEMTRVLEGVCAGDGGAERADCLMKYLYVCPGGSNLSRPTVPHLGLDNCANLNQLQGHVLPCPRQRIPVAAQQIRFPAKHRWLLANPRSQPG